MERVRKLGLKDKIHRKLQQRHEQQTFNKFRMVGLAQQCAQCKWFIYRTEKPRNYVCRAPNERMRFRGNVCLAWEYGEHPEMVVMRSR